MGFNSGFKGLNSIFAVVIAITVSSLIIRGNIRDNIVDPHRATENLKSKSQRIV